MSRCRRLATTTPSSFVWWTMGPASQAPFKIESSIAFFTTKAVGEGTGIGLDIVRRILRRHEAQIEVNSCPGRTEFLVTLPIDAKLLVETPAPASQESHAVTLPVILAVDDDREVLGAIERDLRMQYRGQYRVVACNIAGGRPRGGAAATRAVASAVALVPRRSADAGHDRHRAAD